MNRNFKLSTMKRLFAAALVVATMAVQAQEGPEISSAVIAFDRNNDVPTAKQYLDKATEIINGKDKSTISYKDLRKYYFYMGQVYLRIANSDKPEIQALSSNALEIAADNFKKTIQYEKETGKDRYTEEAIPQYFNTAVGFYQKGIDASDKGNFGQSSDLFMKSYLMKQEAIMGKYMATDTASLLNAAIMAEQASKDQPEYAAKALVLNKQLLEMGYTGRTFTATQAENNQPVAFPNANAMTAAVQSGQFKDPQISEPVTLDLYKSVIRLSKTTGDTVAYKETLAKARGLYPGDEQLIRLELQEYLDAKNYDKAMENLDLALAKDPSNKIFYYIKGFIYQTEVKDPAKALEAYDKALEVDPEYTEVLYMAGLVHVEEANRITEEMNKLKLNETKKYDVLKKKQQDAFSKALPYFEKSYAKNPKDMDTVKALKEVYYKLGMAEKSMEMNKILQGAN